VAAAGVNRPDCMQRQGLYNPPTGAPLTPGLEVAGRIVALGEGVQRWVVGDAVCALVPGGGYAEYAVAHGENCLPVPAGLSVVEAAALPETFFTVWSNVFDRAGLASGETILIHGGSSGIGTTATMLAKAFGASVIVTAGSDDKCAACLALGADHAINYKTQDFVEDVKRISGGAGVNVILDMLGGDYIARDVKCLAPLGRIACIATQRGAKAEVDILALMMKRAVLTGSTLRPRTVAEKAAIARSLEAKVWPLLAAGTCKPQIYKTFPLADAARAHTLMESSAHVGKIVLTV
jgi:NADPH:quinone reductase